MYGPVKWFPTIHALDIDSEAIIHRTQPFLANPQILRLIRVAHDTGLGPVYLRSSNLQMGKTLLGTPICASLCPDFLPQYLKFRSM